MSLMVTYKNDGPKIFATEETEREPDRWRVDVFPLLTHQQYSSNGRARHKFGFAHRFTQVYASTSPMYARMAQSAPPLSTTVYRT